MTDNHDHHGHYGHHGYRHDHGTMDTGMTTDMTTEPMGTDMSTPPAQ